MEPYLHEVSASLQNELPTPPRSRTPSPDGPSPEFPPAPPNTPTPSVIPEATSWVLEGDQSESIKQGTTLHTVTVSILLPRSIKEAVDEYDPVASVEEVTKGRQPIEPTQYICMPLPTTSSPGNPACPENVYHKWRVLGVYGYEAGEFEVRLIAIRKSDDVKLFKVHRAFELEVEGLKFNLEDHSPSYSGDADDEHSPESESEFSADELASLQSANMARHENFLKIHMPTNRLTAEKRFYDENPYAWCPISHEQLYDESYFDFSTD